MKGPFNIGLCLIVLTSLSARRGSDTHIQEPAIGSRDINSVRSPTLPDTPSIKNHQFTRSNPEIREKLSIRINNPNLHEEPTMRENPAVQETPAIWEVPTVRSYTGSVGGIRGSSGTLLKGSLNRAIVKTGETGPFPEEEAFLHRASKAEIGDSTREDGFEEYDRGTRRPGRRENDRVRNFHSSESNESEAENGDSKCDSSTARRRISDNTNHTVGRSKRSGFSSRRSSSSFHGVGRGSGSSRPLRRENNRTREKRLLDEILGNNGYDRKIRPSSANRTGMIRINMYIFLINS